MYKKIYINANIIAMNITNINITVAINITKGLWPQIYSQYKYKYSKNKDKYKYILQKLFYKI